MPNVQQLLNDEIRRLARKEIKGVFTKLQEHSVALRKRISEIDKRLKVIEKAINLPCPAQLEKEIAEKPVRLNAAGILRLRTKLKLSQANFAALLGVTVSSVNHWELGKTAPREAQKKAIAQLRSIGKREAAKRLEAMGKTAKKGASKAAPKAAAEIPASADTSKKN